MMFYELHGRYWISATFGRCTVTCDVLSSWLSFWSSETREHQHALGVHAADLMIYLREWLAEKRLAGFTRSTTYYQILGGIMCRRMCHTSTKVASNHYVLTWLEV